MSVRLVRIPNRLRGKQFVFCQVTPRGDPLPAVWHQQAWRRSTFPYATKPDHWGRK